MSANVFAERGETGSGGTIFHDIAADSYPFVAVFLDLETYEEVWRAVVEAPGATLVPQVSHVDRPTLTRVYFYSGRIFSMGPDNIPHVQDISDSPAMMRIVRGYIDEARGQS